MANARSAASETDAPIVPTAPHIDSGGGGGVPSLVAGSVSEVGSEFGGGSWGAGVAAG